MQKEIDLTPATSQLKSEHANNIGWSAALSELIDNALDAGARNVSITIDSASASLEIADDGAGCDDLTRILKQGERLDHSTTRSGHYGIGAKKAALYFWGTLSVTSTSGGITRSAALRWDDVVASNRFSAMSLPDEKTGAQSGTIIKITGHNRVRNTPSRPALVQFLSQNFWPAAQNGVRIFGQVNGAPFEVDEHPFPTVQDVEDFEGEIEGKRYSGWAGLAVGANAKPGLALVKAHRVVCHSWNDGFEDKNISRLFGVVMLEDRRWRLTSIKNGIEEHGEELGREIAAKLASLAVRSDELSRDLFLDSISEDLSAMLGGTIKVREPGGTAGSKEPKDTDRRQTARPKPESSGGKWTGGGVAKIVPANLGEAIAGVRKQMARGKPVYFIDVNKTRPDVEEALARTDRTAITLLAIAVLSDFISNDDERDVLQRKLPGIEDATKSEAFRRIFGNWFTYGVRKVKGAA
jgi:anti-sigma regulatory factor (Ser/Thr protein kinase)